MSSDILTQLQTCYDQLLIQFFSTLSYHHRRHPLIAPDPTPGDPYSEPARGSLFEEGQSARHRYVKPQLGPEDTDPQTMDLQPQPPVVFDQAQQDLAEDLVRKTQQIEYLIRRLPGINSDEKDQYEEIEQLAEQVTQMEVRRRAKRKEMRECLKQLDDVVMGMARSVDSSNSKKSTVREKTAGSD
jgi:hypothetical protein